MYMILLVKPSVSPLGLRSSSSKTVRSTNSNTKYSRFFRRNTSNSATKLSCLSFFRALISRKAIFRTFLSSSDSMNFLMATTLEVGLCRALLTMP